MVSNSESRRSGEDSELFPKCNEKVLLSFKFGYFENNKENYLKGERGGRPSGSAV